MSAKTNTTSELSARASRKLGPGVWKVTDRALQQATPWQVAQLKAAWFGSSPVHDLCCGIGGDAIQLARRGDLVAIDSDARMCQLVQANLDQLPGLYSVEVRNADVTKIQIPADAAIHIDPDRRSRFGRSVRPENYSPAWSDVRRIVSSAAAAAVKLAPAAIPSLTSLGEIHRCWVSLQGTVREQSLLCGQLIAAANVQPGGRSAVSLRGDGARAWYRPESMAQAGSVEQASEPLGVLIDPDPAVRAAGLTETFALDHGLKLLCGGSGFLTAEQISPAVSEIAITGQVIWSGPCDDRKLRREFRARDVFPQTVKVRGTDHDPQALTKRYRTCGQTPVTLWIGRAGKRVFTAMTAS